MSSARPPDSPLSSPATAAASYGRLARRISGCTSNLLATALVLVIGLGVGRQLIQWWSVDPEAPSVDQAAQAAQGLGDDRRWHILEFGGHAGAIRRKSLTGGAADARESLRAACRHALNENMNPKRQASDAPDAASLARRVDEGPGPAERRLLESTYGLEPSEQAAGRWQMFEFDGPFPLAAGIVANPVRRVLVWGMAVPVGDEAWKLFVFEPAAEQVDSRKLGPSNVGLSEAPLPPGCRRTLAVRQVDGGALVAFRGETSRVDGMNGSDRVQDWQQFYDARLTAQGWQATGAWQGDAAGASRRYGRLQGRKQDGRLAWLAVQFGPDGRGELAGVLSIVVQPERKERAP